MRLLHALAKTRASFDDPNLLSHAGLVPLAALAERDQPARFRGRERAPGRRARCERGLKAACLAAGMAAGADSIDDSTQKRVYGYGKEGAAFGHTKIQGKSLLVKGLTCSAR